MHSKLAFTLFKVIPLFLHCASLLRIIYSVISARSCTRALKNMADLP